MKQYFKKIIILFFVVFSLWGVYSLEEKGFDFSVKGVSNFDDHKLVVYFFDVGQGDATLIRTPSGDDILIDGGPDNTLIKKLGQSMPYGDRDIELMILTHPHSDHVTGLIEVLNRYEVDKILITGIIHTSPDYIAWLEVIKEKNIKVEIIDSERELFLGDVKLEFLYPNASFVKQKVDNLNNTSIVTRLVYGDTSFLFTGDLEIEEELQGDFKSNVYQVGHHGSSNANDKDFLEKVNPDYAVISCGANNHFGHPHFRTLRILENLGVEIFRTDRDGDVVLSSDGREVFVVD